MKITISGTAGSGKSTIAKALAERLGYERHYIGGMRREIAKKKGLTLEEFNKIGETDPSTDKEVDDYQKKLGKEKKNIIIEGRTSFFLIPDSIKLFIIVDEKEGAERILSDLGDNIKSKERNQDRVDDIDEMMNNNREREKCDIKRYKKYYGVENVYDPDHFDIIIDTTGCSIEQSKEKAFRILDDYLRKRGTSLDEISCK